MSNENELEDWDDDNPNINFPYYDYENNHWGETPCPPSPYAPLKRNLQGLNIACQGTMAPISLNTSTQKGMGHLPLSSPSSYPDRSQLS